VRKAASPARAIAHPRSGRRVRPLRRAARLVRRLVLRAERAGKTSKTSRERSRMRTTICRSKRIALTVVGAFVAPAFVSGLVAQDSARAGPRRTHTAPAGETLWILAREYLNDPWQWRELFRLNSGTVRDPHWIYPGQTLELPWMTAGEAPVVPRPARDTTRDRETARDSARDRARDAARD